MITVDNFLNEENLVFLDIEVFAYDWLVVAKDINHNVLGVFRNGVNPWEHEKLVKDNISKELSRLIDGKVVVGYNNYFYDDKILNKLLTTTDARFIKMLNDTIINGHRYKQGKQEFLSLDVFRQIDVSNPSLKKIEANRGTNIEESSIPFDIKRPLTSEELTSTFEYCSHDVSETIETFKLRLDNYFEPKQIIIREILNRWGERYELAQLIRLNITSLMGILILGDKNIEQWNSYHVTQKPTGAFETHYELVTAWNEQDKEFINVQVENGLPQAVVDMWNNSQFNHLTNKFERPTKKVIIEMFENKLEFGFGGLHGVPVDKSLNVFKNVYMLDVASLYPSIMVKLGVLGEGTKYFDNIMQQRLAFKHTKGKEKQSFGLKVGINSTFGCLISQYSNLFNPYGGQSVCMYGQICLFDLAKRLDEIGAYMMNINTDGIGFTHDNMEEIERVWHEWEKVWGFTLELDEFHKIYQKDVNNYIGTRLIEGKETVTKAKGGQVSRYKSNQYFKDNSLRICDIMLVNAIVYKTPLMQTIKDNLDKPLLFQQVLNRTGKFAKTVDDNGTEFDNKVIRVFAVKADEVTDDYITVGKLYKQRADGSRIVFEKLNDTNIIFNDKLENLDIEDFSEMINKKYYLKLGNDLLKQWGFDLSEQGY